jgi:hypothetical protein
MLMLGGLMFFSDASFAYEVSMVFKGSHLSGTVRLVGPMPEPKRYNLVVSPDPYYCGRVSDGKGWRLSPTVQLRSNQGAPNVIVYLQDIDSGKPFDAQSQAIKAQDCRFIPFVSLVQKDKTMTFENWDPVPHKIEIYQASAKGGKLLASQDLKRSPNSRKSDFLVTGNEGTHRPGQPFSYTVGEEDRMVFRCGYHEYMEAWSLVLNHPYFSVTSDTGEYMINDIPAGTFRLVLWHPMGKAERTVEIRDDQTLKMDLELRTIAPNTYQEETAKPNPLGIDLTGDRHIVPTVELQERPPDDTDNNGNQP